MQASLLLSVPAPLSLRPRVAGCPECNGRQTGPHLAPCAAQRTLESLAQGKPWGLQRRVSSPMTKIKGSVPSRRQVGPGDRVCCGSSIL